MCSAKKHNKKGLKKNRANSTKAMCLYVKSIMGLKKANKVKCQIPKCIIQKLNQPAYIPYPKLRKHATACIASGLTSAHPRPRPRPNLKSRPCSLSLTAPPAAFPALAQVPKGAQAPMKTPERRTLSASMRTEGLV
ncbi:hypothetical protein P7K49_021953 [Saguinus oedipus]|uniref:60S ribosomal protein L29 n=1 Tax=Saguinus oedipus TaxID=9490 RepID=A0ABQ9UV07_SAGOE|nr:hypothetical protein P7K49_021953 [Saguinus oedipus]